MKVEEAKVKYEVKTSEDLFGIIHPPEHQCKNIDKIIKTINGIYKSTDNPRKLEEDDIVDLLNDINYDLYHMDDDIEDIRKALEEVREWGQQWKDKCKEIIERYDLNIEDLI